MYARLRKTLLVNVQCFVERVVHNFGSSARPVYRKDKAGLKAWNCNVENTKRGKMAGQLQSYGRKGQERIPSRRQFPQFIPTPPHSRQQQPATYYCQVFKITPFFITWNVKICLQPEGSQDELHKVKVYVVNSPVIAKQCAISATSPLVDLPNRILSVVHFWATVKL